MPPDTLYNTGLLETTLDQSPAVSDINGFYRQWHVLDVEIRHALARACQEHDASAEEHRALDAALDYYQGALRLLIAHLFRGS